LHLVRKATTGRPTSSGHIFCESAERIMAKKDTSVMNSFGASKCGTASVAGGDEAEPKADLCAPVIGQKSSFVT